jgi:hypothetical protein
MLKVFLAVVCGYCDFDVVQVERLTSSVDAEVLRVVD